MVRQVVTGHRDGKSVFVSDGTPLRSYDYQHAVGSGLTFAWATPADTKLSLTDIAESVTVETATIPKVGETRLLFLRVAPDSVAAAEGYDFAAAIAEMAAASPDVTATFEQSGFHRTDSIDYVIVVQGEISLELDDGAEKSFKAGDVIVQGGTRHAWRNRSNDVAVLAVILVGAQRDNG